MGKLNDTKKNFKLNSEYYASERLILLNLSGQVAEFKFELKFRVKFYAILESISKIIDC